MHLVGFIIRIYYDARSPECQIHMAVLVEKPNREELRKSIKLYAWYKKSFYEGEA